MRLRQVILWGLALFIAAGLGLTAQAFAYKSAKSNIMEKCLELGSYPENCGCLASYKIGERGFFGSFIMLGSDLAWLDSETVEECYCSC